MSRNAGKLKPYDFTFAKIYGRENLMPLRGLLIKHQILFLSTDLFYISNITGRQY